MLGAGTARLQAQKLALCLPHPYLMGHFGILPAVPLLAFLLCHLLLKGRKMQLVLCPALPHPQYTYKSCSRNTKTTARFGNPSYLLPQVPLVQRQLADLSYISCPSEQIHPPLYPLCHLASSASCLGSTLALQIVLRASFSLLPSFSSLSTP